MLCLTSSIHCSVANTILLLQAWLNPLHLPAPEQLTCPKSSQPLHFLLQVSRLQAELQLTASSDSPVSACCCFQEHYSSWARLQFFEA